MKSCIFLADIGAMKKLTIVFVLVIGLAGSKNLAAQDRAKPQSLLNISPFGGINLDKKLFVYGGELGYEYRINNRWSAIANVMFSTGSTNDPKKSYAGTTSLTVDHLRVNEYAFSVGVKYYIGNFYVSGGIGYGYYDKISSGWYDYPGIDPANATRQEGKISENGIYQNYEMGYKIPLKSRNNLEIFIKGYGTHDANVVTGLRYSFGLGKK